MADPRLLVPISAGSPYKLTHVLKAVKTFNTQTPVPHTQITIADWLSHVTRDSTERRMGKRVFVIVNAAPAGYEPPHPVFGAQGTDVFVVSDHQGNPSTFVTGQLYAGLHMALVPESLRANPVTYPDLKSLLVIAERIAEAFCARLTL